MKKLVLALLPAARSSLKSRRELALENLALRQQLAVLQRPAQRPKLFDRDCARARGDHFHRHCPYEHKWIERYSGRAGPT
jgi:hypothetical protein